MPELIAVHFLKAGIGVKGWRCLLYESPNSAVAP